VTGRDKTSSLLVSFSVLTVLCILLYYPVLSIPPYLWSKLSAVAKSPSKSQLATLFHKQLPAKRQQKQTKRMHFDESVYASTFVTVSVDNFTQRPHWKQFWKPCPSVRSTTEKTDGKSGESHYGWDGMAAGPGAGDRPGLSRFFSSCESQRLVELSSLRQLTNVWSFNWSGRHWRSASRALQCTTQQLSRFKPKFHYANFATKSADFVTNFPRACIVTG